MTEFRMIDFRDVSTEERKKAAGAGAAMPDGSYPIANCSDLRNAVRAIGRAKDPARTKAHIRKRKAALGCPDVELPEAWAALTFDVNDGQGISHRDEAELAGVAPEDVITSADDVLENGVTHAGFAVQAADTGRALMIQRSLDQNDPPEVMGTWEFPGGGLEDGETAEEAARREFCEETGLPVPAGEVTGGWRSPDGIYQGYVFTTPVEATAFPELNPDLAAAELVNPDDPQRRNPDVSAWFTLDQILNLGPALRPEVYETDWSQFATITQEGDMEPTAPEASAEVTAGDGYIPWHGVLLVEDTRSGDGRGMTPCRQRPLPLPFRWQKEDLPGHQGSVVVGRIDATARVGSEVRATGVLFPTTEADQFVGLAANFPRFGVSIDGDDVTMAFDDEQGTTWYENPRVSGATGCPIPAFFQAWSALGEAPEGFMDGESIETSAWDDPKVAVVASAAVEFGRGPGWITNPEDTKRIHDYWTRPGEEGYVKIGWGAPGGGDFNRCRLQVGEEIAENSPEDLVYLNQICAQWHYDALGYWPGHAPSELAAEVVNMPDSLRQTFRLVEREEIALAASGAGLVAPAAWFRDPEFTGADDPRMVQNPNTGGWGAPLMVTEEGQVFGHIATRGTCHTGMPGVCREAPMSSTGYAYFLLGQVLTTEGMVPCGSLTVGGGHADVRLGMRAAMEHYDNSCSAWADVAVGDDEFGIWCAGWVRPGTSPEMVVAARASKLSGDWRPAGQPDLELMAALCVNMPGYPIPRVHIAAGLQTSLVAAGVVQGEHQGDWAGGSIADIAAAVEQRMIDRRETEALVARLDREETAALLARSE
jgi:8-oxo-dGTP pyrophosphatase MutT (NUDIX family)